MKHRAGTERSAGGRAIVAAVLWLALIAPAGAEPVENLDYFRIDPPAPHLASPGKIEVVEVFAYHCVHCARMQESVDAWLPGLAHDVDFRYVPAAHGAAEVVARGFYGAAALGAGPAVHGALFRAMAIERRLRGSSVEDVVRVYREAGFVNEQLPGSMTSFVVDAQIARAQRSIERWTVEDTPTFIVNGRYRVVVTSQGGHAGALRTVDALIGVERARLASELPASTP